MICELNNYGLSSNRTKVNNKSACIIKNPSYNTCIQVYLINTRWVYDEINGISLS
ncbi:hypothetical protein bcgnr5385_58260 [Bacillus cereus]